MRQTTLALVLLALLPACGSDKKSDDLAACEQPAIDLSGCNTASLDAFAGSGVYNTQLTNADGTGAGVAAMRVDPAGASAFFGLPASNITATTGSGTFFISGSYTVQGTSGKVSFAGCEALSERQLRGFFRRCNQGFASTEGTFVAERLARRPGEGDASGLELLSEQALPRGMATSVYVSGTTAYVIAENTGIFLYDISDPAHPKPGPAVEIANHTAEVGTNGDRWAAVKVVGNQLFVTSDVRGLLVFDLSNVPTSLETPPQVLPADANAGRALNNLAYDAATQRLYGFSHESGAVQVYNTEAATPVLVTNFVSGVSPGTGDAPLDGALASGRLYVSQGSSGLVVLNVSNPAAPVRVGALPLASNSRTLAVGSVQDKLYAFETGGLWGSRVRALDLTNTLALSQVGEFALRDAVPVSRLALSGTRLYVAYAQDGLRVLDVSNPAQPSQAAYFNTWRASDPGHGVRFVEGASGVQVTPDGYIFVADTTRGLLVLREAPTAGGLQEGSAR